MVRTKIGQIIANQRLRKGITQEQLAECVGVSKSAVSKWELSQSCPDVSLLPFLAGYFDITVDELLGFESQISMDEVARICDKLARDFEKQPFTNVRYVCNRYICQYSSSSPLLFAIGQMLITYGAKSDCQNERKAVYEKALKLFCKVERQSKDALLRKRAKHMQAACFLLMGCAYKVTELLDDEVGFQNLTEPLLAEARMRIGDRFRAQGIVGTAFLLNLSSIFLVSAELIEFMGEDGRIEVFLQAVIQMAQVLDLERLAPHAYLTVILTGAKHLISQRREADALELLVDFASSFHRNTKTKVVTSQELGDCSHSRALMSIYTGDHVVVHHMMVTRLMEDPSFDKMRSNSVFQKIMRWHKSVSAQPV